ncbi:hypothetical protein RB653_007171 [Dictyostelium firmibasis]|uniref:A-kinase anchor protein 7-like phosphoesterase domain-containing protein n=1 Tax=Dictyostelium firmibasis TaxID=79012 RepID=A0AAN7U3A8_9MYCE
MKFFNFLLLLSIMSNQIAKPFLPSNGGRMNYFFGLQITEVLINNQLKQIQNSITRSCRYVAKDITSPEKFHMTLFVMELTDEQIPIIKSTLMPQAKLLATEIFGENIKPSSSIKGIGSFKDRVIWAGINEKHDEYSKLLDFRNRLHKLFKDQNIKVEDEYKDWSPHITLAKGKNVQRNFLQIKSHLNEDLEFGLQNFSKLQLMKIGATDPLTKYYHVEDTIDL